MTYRILVTGSRDWPKERATEVRDAILAEVGDRDPSTVTVVHGACVDHGTGWMRGADRWADLAAERHSLGVERHPADWRAHGKPAGMIRNREMVAGGADICLAFPLGKSPGTRGCMTEAEKAGIPVRNLGDPPEQ